MNPDDSRYLAIAALIRCKRVESELSIGPLLVDADRSVPPEMKQADVAEDPEVFHHVGLLITEPPGLGRAALQLIFRRIRLTAADRIEIGKRCAV